jgi:hypothetical protein
MNSTTFDGERPSGACDRRPIGRLLPGPRHLSYFDLHPGKDKTTQGASALRAVFRVGQLSTATAKDALASPMQLTAA